MEIVFPRFWTPFLVALPDAMGRICFRSFPLIAGQFPQILPTAAQKERPPCMVQRGRPPYTHSVPNWLPHPGLHAAPAPATEGRAVRLLGRPAVRRRGVGRGAVRDAPGADYSRANTGDGSARARRQPDGINSAPVAKGKHPGACTGRFTEPMGIHVAPQHPQCSAQKEAPCLGSQGAGRGNPLPICLLSGAISGRLQRNAEHGDSDGMGSPMATAEPLTVSVAPSIRGIGSPGKSRPSGRLRRLR